MKRLTIRQALVATLVTTLIYRQGVDQIFFGGGDYMIWDYMMEGDQSSPTEYTGGVIKILHSLMEGSGTNKGHSLYSLSLTEQIMST